MKYQLTCQYCDHQWITELYAHQVKDLRCSRCNDRNISAKKVKSGNVFGYAEDDKKPDAYFKSEDEDDFPFGD